jgi:hypothetical protein
MPRPLEVQGMVAENERAKILERSRRGKRHAARAGIPNVLSGAPYGYQHGSVAEGGGQARYEPVPEQARVMQQIFTWIGRERASIAQSAAACNRPASPARKENILGPVAAATRHLPARGRPSAMDSHPSASFSRGIPLCRTGRATGRKPPACPRGSARSPLFEGLACC